MAPELDPADIRRIVVFRALVLGDLLCAVPALRALRRAFPGAEITLVSLPWAAELAQRLSVIDRFVAFPGFPGLPEREPDLAALPAFLRVMQEARYDLALQMHGSGQLVNPLVAAFGARHTAGFVIPGQYAPQPPLFAPWPIAGHEIERLLHLTDHLGLPRQGVHLEFPLTAADLAWRDERLGAGSYVCVHPGAQLPSRRWPVERLHSWMNGFGKLRRCTDKRKDVVEFYLYLAAAITVIRRLINRARSLYRWPTRPTTRRLR